VSSDKGVQVYKILVELKLDHLWESEQIGSYEDWGFLVADCVKQRDIEEWSKCLQQKAKLRWYRQIKFALKKEDYLSWISRVIIVNCTRGSAVVRIG
jgi:hypothetical protein